jgi:hypothetical protein
MPTKLKTRKEYAKLLEKYGWELMPTIWIHRKSEILLYHTEYMNPKLPKHYLVFTEEEIRHLLPISFGGDLFITYKEFPRYLETLSLHTKIK